MTKLHRQRTKKLISSQCACHENSGHQTSLRRGFQMTFDPCLGSDKR